MTDERTERAARIRLEAEQLIERNADLEAEQNLPPAERSWHREERGASAPYGSSGKGRAGLIGAAAPAEPREPDAMLARTIEARIMAMVDARLEAALAAEREHGIELLAEILASTEAKLDAAADELRREVQKVTVQFDTLIRMAGGGKPEPRNDSSVIDLPPLPRRSMN